jgi:hypothetical protein
MRVQTQSNDTENSLPTTVTVADDPDRSAVEKETGITIVGNEPVATIHAYRASVVRRLIGLPHFELQRATLRDSDARVREVASFEEVQPDEDVIGVVGQIPVGAIKISCNPRQSDEHTFIVSR